MIQYKRIKRKHLSGIINLCKIEDWPSYYENPETTWRTLTAPGVTTIVAVDHNKAVGFAQLPSYGLIQAHPSNILVDRNYRKRGIGTRLIKKAFARCGGKRIDLITDDMPDFYRSFNHKELLP